LQDRFREPIPNRQKNNTL